MRPGFFLGTEGSHSGFRREFGSVSVFMGCYIRLRTLDSHPATLILMLWIKALHIVFVASWFAGLFYLPRIFVNLAMVSPGSVAERARLVLMARKLYRFMTILALPALGLGLWLWLGYGIGRGPGNGWMHAKLLIVILLIGYHFWCGHLLRGLEADRPTRSHVWFRWFNEAPVLMLLAAVILVVVKPF